jgi:hypothetical protein
MLYELMKVVILWIAFFLGFLVGLGVGCLGILVLLYLYKTVQPLRADKTSKITSEE